MIFFHTLSSLRAVVLIFHFIRVHSTFVCFVFFCMKPSSFIVPLFTSPTQEYATYCSLRYVGVGTNNPLTNAPSSAREKKFSASESTTAKG